jgi:hypothetical protein
MSRLNRWLPSNALRIETLETREVPAAPGVFLASAIPMETNASAIPVTASFSEDVTGFLSDDLVVTNATVANFTAVNGSTYRFDLIPVADGLVSARVPAGVAVNAGNESNTSSGARLLRAYDGTGPVPQIMLGDGQGVSTTGTTATFKVVFNENVTGFGPSSVVVGGTAGGTATEVTGSGRIYQVNVTDIKSAGTVTIRVLAGATTDTLNNSSFASQESPAVMREVELPPAPTPTPAPEPKPTPPPTAEQKPLGLPKVVATAGPGSNGTEIRVIDPKSGNVLQSITPFPGFSGTIGMAQGDLTGDGVADVVAGAGANGAPHVKLYDGVTGAELRSFLAYDSGFRGGVSVAVGDVTGDGTSDIVVAAGAGGGPHVRVFDGKSGNLVRSFFAYDPSFRNGLSVATGDVNGDGKADIVTGAREGGAPHVKVFDGMASNEIYSFYAYDTAFRGGVNIAVGDITGDGKMDIITGTGVGGTAHVKAFDGATGASVRSFFAYDPAFTGGVRVSVTDANDDQFADIVTGTGLGGGPHVKLFKGENGMELKSFFAFSPTSTQGVSVG